MTTRALFLDPSDRRPRFASGGSLLRAPLIIGGAVAALVFHLGVVPAIFGLGFVLHVVSDASQEDEEDVPWIEEDIIEARFVTLGRDFADQLPNREVPRLSTAPARPAEVPTEATPIERAPEEPQEEPPPESVQGLLTILGDRADLFAEIAEEREREGNPDGVEEGTESEASPGDLYAGRVAMFFRRGWSVPTTLPRERVQELRATAIVEIGASLEIVSFRIRDGSGDPIFDQSIVEQLTRLQATDQHLPPPPEEVAEEYLGRSRPIRFNGRQAG